MERAVALKKLQKLIGKKMGYRYDPNASSPEEREEAKAQLTQAVAERDATEKTMNERRRAILAADAEYQAAVAARKQAGDRVSKLNGIIHRKRVTVGWSNNIAGLGFFHVDAEGDSWEEVISKVEAKRNSKV